ncbi:MAG TPA: ROK family protein [Thermotogota bacterium]|nr:ROK family protein [Thermotogota bacterium]HRW92474.1 ROK family protein [Thermotogota bacterium]
MKVIGIDLGGSSIKGALVSEDGTVGEKRALPTQVSEGREVVAQRIAQVVQQLAENQGNVMVGIGSPGSVNRERGLVHFSPNFPDWNDFPLVSRVQQITGFPVFLENDAKAAALGEKWFGAAKGCENFFVLTLGTGVGGGAVTNGHLMVGGQGIGGELGHISVNPHGPVCGCGNRGCIEAYASNSGMRQRVLEWKRRYPDSRIFDLAADGEFGAREIFLAFQQKDRLAQLVVEQFIWALGVGIGSLVSIFNPERVILSGGISQSAPLFLEKVYQVANEHTILSMVNSFELIASTLRENAAIFGAASVALERST